MALIHVHRWREWGDNCAALAWSGRLLGDVLPAIHASEAWFVTETTVPLRVGTGGRAGVVWAGACVQAAW